MTAYDYGGHEPGRVHRERPDAQATPTTAENAARVLAEGPTVADVATRYMQEHVAVRCKATTARTVRNAIEAHIVPNLGHYPFATVGRAQVMKLHHRLRGTPGQANVVISTLSQMFRSGQRWGLVEEGVNPCRFVPKYRIRKRERYLTNPEIRRLARALDEAALRGGATAASVAAIRLLMLTGCRRNEILTLRWDDVDLQAGVIRLRDTKTGAREAPLSPSAAGVLDALPRKPGDEWVIPGRVPGTHMRKLDNAWRTIRARAGLHDVRLHDLRHSFASRALALGESLPMIGRLLGHRQIKTTARYAHLDRASVHDAADRVAQSIAADIFHDTADAPAKRS